MKAIASYTRVSSTSVRKVRKVNLNVHSDGRSKHAKH
jgi:hypothetical protein